MAELAQAGERRRQHARDARAGDRQALGTLPALLHLRGRHSFPALTTLPFGCCKTESSIALPRVWVRSTHQRSSSKDSKSVQRLSLCKACCANRYLYKEVDGVGQVTSSSSERLRDICMYTHMGNLQV